MTLIRCDFVNEISLPRDFIKCFRHNISKSFQHLRQKRNCFAGFDGSFGSFINKYC